MSVNPEDASPPTPHDALDCLLPEVVESLGMLFDKPKVLAVAALSSLSFGSRAALEEMGIIFQAQEGYMLTSFGYDVAFAARQRNSE